MHMLNNLAMSGRSRLECEGVTSPWLYGRSLSRKILSWVVCLGALSPLAHVHAEPATLPGFNPRQTEKYFDDQKPAAAPVQAPSPQFGNSQGAGGGKLFVLRAITLSGTSAIPRARLAAAYQPYLGKPVSQADLAHIAGAISDLYRAEGYHLSRAIVPPQDIADGRLKIQVIEGSITEVALKGEGAEEFGVRRMLDPVLAEQPSRLATMERQLMLINGRPGVRIADSAIEEIGTASGHFRLVLSLATWHLYSSVGLDNLGSSTVGPWQSYATAAYNSLAVPGDTLAVNLSTTPGDTRQLAFGRLFYEAPVGTDGARLGGSVLYSEVRPGDERRLYNDNTVTESYEVHGSITPIQSQQASLVLTAALTFTDVTERSVFGSLYDDKIRVLSLTSDYRWNDGLGGNNFLTGVYRQGLDMFGASKLGDDFSSSDRASPSFSAFTAWYSRYQMLPADFSIKLSGAAQVATGPLYTSQQFFLGGSSFGRGYGAAEISGDNALAGSFELRYDIGLHSTYLTGIQLYSFVDAGLVWNDGYKPTDGGTLTSAGGGIRFNLWNDMLADVGVAFPLSYRAPDNDTRSARFLFSLSSALKLCPQRGRGACL